MKTIFVHTDAANAAKVNAIAGNLKGEEDKIEKVTADSATLLKKDAKGEFEAVVSAGLPKVQEIVAGYKKQGVTCHVVGMDSSPTSRKSGASDNNEV